MKPGADRGRELPFDAGSESRSLQLALKAVRNYAIYLVDNDGYVSSWSAGAERFFGYAADEIVGQPIARFYLEEDQKNDEGSRILAEAMHEGTVDVEGWRVRKDGTRFWASVAVEAVRDDDGEIICFAIIMRDNTSKHAAERALQSKDRYFQTSVAGVRDYAIFMLDPAGVITSWNAGAKAIKGYEANEVVGRNFDILYTEDDRASGQPAQALTTAPGGTSFASSPSARSLHFCRVRHLRSAPNCHARNALARSSTAKPRTVICGRLRPVRFQALQCAQRPSVHLPLKPQYELSSLNSEPANNRNRLSLPWDFDSSPAAGEYVQASS